MNGAEKAGIVILALEGAFGIWSAVNPSRFTIRKFTETQKDLDDIHTGFVVASVMISGLVFAVVLIYADANWPMAAGLAAAAGITAYFLGAMQTSGVVPNATT